MDFWNFIDCFWSNTEYGVNELMNHRKISWEKANWKFWEFVFGMLHWIHLSYIHGIFYLIGIDDIAISLNHFISFRWWWWCSRSSLISESYTFLSHGYGFHFTKCIQLLAIFLFWRSISFTTWGNANAYERILKTLT